MKKYVFFLIVAVFFAGCEEKQKPNVPEGMSMESYTNYKTLGFSDEQIAKEYKQSKALITPLGNYHKKKKSLREPIRFDHHKD